MRLKIDWASLLVGSIFTVFALFYFVFESNFPGTRPRGAYIWRGDLTEGFLRYRFGGLIFGGAYFRNFTVCYRNTLSESWFYFAKWVINITPICVITDTIIYPFRLKYHFIIMSPDKFHLSCIIFGGAEGGIIFRNIGITIGR